MAFKPKVPHARGLPWVSIPTELDSRSDHTGKDKPEAMDPQAWSSKTLVHLSHLNPRAAGPGPSYALRRHSRR